MHWHFKVVKTVHTVPQSPAMPLSINKNQHNTQHLDVTHGFSQTIRYNPTNMPQCVSLPDNTDNNIVYIHQDTLQSLLQQQNKIMATLQSSI